VKELVDAIRDKFKSAGNRLLARVAWRSVNLAH